MLLTVLRRLLCGVSPLEESLQQMQRSLATISEHEYMARHGFVVSDKGSVPGDVEAPADSQSAVVTVGATPCMIATMQLSGGGARLGPLVSVRAK